MRLPDKVSIGVIGGSGFDQFPELKRLRYYEGATPFGTASGRILIGRHNQDSDSRVVAFIPRHGRKHSLPPHRVPYYANIASLRSLGVRRIIGTCVVGSLRRDIRPGDFVIPDQFIDRTWGRDDTFSHERQVIHLPMGQPYCPKLRKVLSREARKMGIRVHEKGTVVVVQGPRFSTTQESRWFAKQRWDIVNMTQYPECYFARLSRICYASIAMVTDYDVGLGHELSFSSRHTARILRIFRSNIEIAKRLLLAVIHMLPDEADCSCHRPFPDPYFKADGA